MRDLVVRKLLDYIPGQIILVNIYRALEEAEESIDPHLVTRFLDGVVERVRKLGEGIAAGERQFLKLVHGAAFDRGAELLLQGREAETGDKRYIVFKSLEGIKKLLRDATIQDERLDLLLSSAGNCYDEALSGYCVDLAAYINELAEDAPLFLGPLVPNGEGRRCIAWFTQPGTCPNLDNCPDDETATKVRDWLGLGDTPMNMPIFAFESKIPLQELKPVRPLVFDGIEHRWFKYGLDKKCPRDNWGRATNLERLRASQDGNLDGGPEAVGFSLQIPHYFICRYIGRSEIARDAPDAGYVKRLAHPHGVDYIAGILESKFAARAAL